MKHHLGDGSAFKRVAREAGGGKEGAAIAAIEGRKKYGEKKMEKWAEKGRAKSEALKKKHEDTKTEAWRLVSERN